MTWDREQAQFWSWINRPQDLNESAEQIADLLAPHAHLSQAEALSIYNNAYHQRLVEVSSALFPILYSTLGKDLYTRLWIGYMGKYPPRSGPIHRVGEALSQYVGEHERFRDLPAVGDIVRMEILLNTLFDKADETACTLQELQALPADEWPGMLWQAKQDWDLLRSRFDLERYWRKMQEFTQSGSEPGSAEFGIEALVPTPLPDLPNYLIYRKQHRMQFQLIRPEMAVFLRAIKTGTPFAGICIHLAETFPEQDIPALSLSLLLQSLTLELLCSKRTQAAQ